MKPVYAIVLDTFEPLYPDQWPVTSLGHPKAVFWQIDDLGRGRLRRLHADGV